MVVDQEQWKSALNYVSRKTFSHYLAKTDQSFKHATIVSDFVEM